MRLKTTTKAMILAAGLGKRLRPYTDSTPKPLLKIAGKPLIDWTLDHLGQAGISEVAINTFYKAEQLREHLAQRPTPHINLIVEEELLGTGGAVQNALPMLGERPFFVLNSNIIWINKGPSALVRLENYWNDETMDVLALVVDKTKLSWYKGKGDFTVEDTDYRMRRITAGQDSPILATGIFLIHPRAFENLSDGAFPLTQVMDEAARNGRLHGLLHQGDWFSISTAQEYQSINRLLSE